MGQNEKIMVTKSFLPPMEQYINKIKTIWENNWLTNNGPLHEEFREKLEDRLGVNNISLFVNGHSALEAALSTIEEGGEVITTPFTFASTTHSIIRNGLVPVFCDINEESYSIDADKIEELITPNTKAIVPVHVYGIPCDVYKIKEIADKYELKVIYDAAHVFGVEIDNKPIASFGDIVMFSLHATKVFHSIEGGILVDNTAKCTSHFNLYKNFGIAGPEEVLQIGCNAKMNEFQAAMGIVNLEYLDKEIIKRKAIVEEYTQGLEGIKGIKLLKYSDNIKYNYSYYPIVVEEEYGMTRDELYNKLAENNVYARKYFYPLVTEYSCYAERYSSKSTPIAKYISDRILTLPIYGDLSLEDVKYIIDIIYKG